MCLIAVGGALGGLVGGFAVYTNIRVFRRDRGVASRYALTGLISLGSVVGFVIGLAFLGLLLSAS